MKGINITSWIDVNVAFIRDNEGKTFGQFFCDMFEIEDKILCEITNTTEAVNNARLKYYDNSLPYEMREGTNRAHVSSEKLAAIRVTHQQ
jgi:hypothetical protein